MKKCKVCDSLVDDAGDEIYYCPVCGRILSELDVLPTQDTTTTEQLSAGMGQRSPFKQHNATEETPAPPHSLSSFFWIGFLLLAFAWLGKELPLLLLLGLYLGSSQIKRAYKEQNKLAIWISVAFTLVVVLVTLYYVLWFVSFLCKAVFG